MFPCPRSRLRIWSRETGSVVPSRVSLLISILRLNPTDFRDSVHKPTYAIGSVPSLSGYAITYRWRSLPRVRRHRTSKPQRTVVPNGCCLGRSPCVCVCVFFPSILDINGRTSRGHTGGRSHRIFNPPSFCGACLDFCREKDSAIPFPRRP